MDTVQIMESSDVVPPSARDTVQVMLVSLQAHSGVSVAEALHFIGQLTVWRSTTQPPSFQYQLPGLTTSALSGLDFRELFNAPFTPRGGGKKLDSEHFRLAFHE